MSSTAPVVSTMNGSSMPIVMALTLGLRSTKRFGTGSMSRVSAHSRRSLSSSGYCVGPTRIDDASAINRSPRSL